MTASGTGLAPPAVSVVMVTYGRWDVVRSALEALVANTEPVYELIMVDNASPTAAPFRPEDIVGRVRQVRNEANLGFGAASNQGALHARSPNLCFLNSDALVKPGWLPPLLSRLARDPCCAAVVPCKLNVDGSLQEACSLVAGDGAVYLYGSGQDPLRPEYRFARQVDYGGAACLVARRAAFAAVGGFDPRYGVGYYEDLDLCFSLRRHGWRVVYEPGSVVRHLGGASSSYEDAVQVAEQNRHVFHARWAHRLRGRPTSADCSVDAGLLTTLRDHDAEPRVLVVDDAQSERVADLAVAIARHWPTARVTLVQPGGPTRDRPAVAGLELLNDRDLEALVDRRCHYSVVVAPPTLSPARWRALDETQPQARLALCGGGGPLFPGSRLPARRVDVALAARGGTSQPPPAFPVVSVGEPIDDETLEEALSYVGVAPPRQEP